MVAPITPVNVLPAADPSTRAARTAFSRREAAHDAGLVSRFKSGDQSAFVEIVTRYRARLSQVAWHLLKNQADAEEIAQDTFVRAHRSLALFRGESSLYSWLHRITLNLSRNRYWYFHHRRRHLAQSLDGPIRADSQTTFADLLASPAPGPAHQATMTEFSRLVAASMGELSPTQREVLILRNVREQSYSEIAGALGITIGTVKSRVARAREQLRTLLAGKYAAKPRPGQPAAFGHWFEPGRPADYLASA